MELSVLFRPTTYPPPLPIPPPPPLPAALHRSHRLSPPRISSSFRIESPSSNDNKRLFVFGMGFVGRYVSNRLMQEQYDIWDVSGTCTSTLKKGELEDMGFKAYAFEATQNRLEKLNSLQYATHLLVSIPPLPTLGDPLLFMLENLRDILSKGNLRWLCYLSSTSVYGDCQGALVNEDYLANPASDSAKARLAAEKGWLDLGIDLHVPSYVFRLGGTYGPGRSALNTIMKGKMLTQLQRMRASKSFTARVHVADIYQAIKASFYPSPSGIYNVVDDDPAPRAEVFAFAKGLIEEKFPGWMKVNLPHDAVNMTNWEEAKKGEKRVSNARLKTDLGVNLIYPSYREGLRSLLDSV